MVTDALPRLRLGVVGWRFFPHSYALANQYQLAALLDRTDCSLFCRDAPFYFSAAKQTTGLMEEKLEARIRAIPNYDDDTEIDREYRISFPFDFRPARVPLTVFMTCESGREVESIVGGGSFASGQRNSGARVVTPSNWSKAGLVRCGGDPDRIDVVPLGFDPKIFYPTTEQERNPLRRSLGLADRFVFLNVSAMTDNKGIGVLLRAFAIVHSSHPEAILLLKGLDDLYSSNQILAQMLKQLGISENVSDNIRYVGITFSYRNLASIYHAADCYVSPYFCEGFNLPVLEAAACGLPVIITKGGATDDFTDPSFATYIESRAKEWREPRSPHVLCAMLPDTNHLVELMRAAISDEMFRRSAKETSVRYVTQRFTWQQSVEKLIDVLWLS